MSERRLGMGSREWEVGNGYWIGGEERVRVGGGGGDGMGETNPKIL